MAHKAILPPGLIADDTSAGPYFKASSKTWQCRYRSTCLNGGEAERPDQRKRPEAGSNRYAVACVPIMVGIAVPIMVVIDVSNRVASGNQENAPSMYDEWFELPLAIAGGCDGPRA